MGDVIALSTTRKVNNREISHAQKQSSVLKQAMQKLNNYNGIDYDKLLSGDSKEQQRFTMLQYQSSIED